MANMDVVSSEFWKGKKVLVTGHTGFKGSWLTFWLSEMGAEVSGISLPSESEFLWKRLKLENKVRSFWGDINDPVIVGKALDDSSAEIIFHMAAQSLVKDGYDDPAYTFSTNIMGTVNLLLCSRDSQSIRTIVNVTTDKVYAQNSSGVPHEEKDSLGGHDPYSASKACSELVTSSIRSSFFPDSQKVRISTARSGNVIGGGDTNAFRLLPDLVKSLLKGEVFKLRNPHSIRPWMHVLDALHGYLLLAEKMQTSEVFTEPSFNFSPGSKSHTTVQDILDYVKISYPHLALKTSSLGEKFPEEEKIILNSELAKDILKWKHRWDYKKAVKATIDWHLELQNDEDASTICRRQIEEFLS